MIANPHNIEENALRSVAAVGRNNSIFFWLDQSK
jgi:hypothetical protein